MRRPITLHHLAASCGLFVACAAAAAPCDDQVRAARAANEQLRAEVFKTHPPHPRGALALQELKRSDELLDTACRDGMPAFAAAGMAFRNARDRLAGRMAATY